MTSSSHPAGWTVKPFSEWGQWLSGGTPSKSRADYWGGQIPWISSKDLYVRYVRDAGLHITEEGAQRGTRQVGAGTLLVVVRSMALAKGLMAGLTTRQVAFNQDVKAIVPHDDVDPHFLLFAFWGHEREIRHLIDEASHGTKRLSTEQLGGFQMPLPPLSEQRRIAGALGALDAKIETNHRIIMRLDEIGRHLWLRRFGPYQRGSAELPPEWNLGVLSDLVTTQYGYTASASADATGPRFLRVMDINKQNWIEWKKVPFCEVADADAPKYRLERGDIVVARMADPGKSAIVESDVDAVFASYLVRLSTPDLATAYFVYGYLKSPVYESYAARTKSGSVQQNMNAKVIVASRVAIPPRAEMEGHLAEVLPLRRLLSHCVEQNARLANLRDALLPKLVSGEIRIPEDYLADVGQTVAV